MAYTHNTYIYDIIFIYLIRMRATIGSYEKDDLIINQSLSMICDYDYAQYAQRVQK